MCEATSATTEVIYAALNKKISQLLNTFETWQNCASVTINNTSANIGMQNSPKTKIIVLNDSIYFSGCPCHMIHNVA